MSSHESLKQRMAAVMAALRTNERLHAVFWLVAILYFLYEEKVPFTKKAFGPLPDGGYYMNIAQHVRDGEGLISDLSLAHKAAPHLPHPTDMYPLWPLVYGYLARLFPIEPLGHWLPTLLYFGALLTGYAWAAGLSKRGLALAWLPGFNAGHLFVLMLGLNGEFFRYTSYPYTEGLTYTVVLLGLWRMNRLWGRMSLLGGLELGVWLGLATLARKQLFLMALAAPPVLIGALVFQKSHRAALVKMTAGVWLGFSAVTAPHYWYMSTFLPDMSPGKFLRWDQNQHTDALTQLRTLRQVRGLGPYLRDRLSGFPIAFGRSNSSYTAQFYMWQYGAIVAVPAALLAAWRRARGRVLAETASCFAPESLHLTYALVFALGGFLSIHTMHMHPDASGEWMFGGRHALTSIFLFFLASAFLLRTARFPWTAAGVFLTCTSIYLGVARLHEWDAFTKDQPPRPTPFTEWVNGERQARGKLTLALRQPQTLVHLTPGVGYHWYGDYTPFRDICAMTAKLGVDYVVVVKRARFQNDPTFKTSFEQALTIGGTHIYAPVAGGDCAPHATGTPTGGR